MEHAERAGAIHDQVIPARPGDGDALGHREFGRGQGGRVHARAEGGIIGDAATSAYRDQGLAQGAGTAVKDAGDSYRRSASGGEGKRALLRTGDQRRQQCDQYCPNQQRHPGAWHWLI